VNRTTVFPTNPVYGLNAMGGPFVIEMKNGFNYEGGEASAMGGSFGTRQFTLQYGNRVGDFGANIAGNAFNDEGFRRAKGPQSLAGVGRRSRLGRRLWHAVLGGPEGEARCGSYGAERVRCHRRRQQPAHAPRDARACLSGTHAPAGAPVRWIVCPVTIKTRV
jgi:hypothetical protein